MPLAARAAAFARHYLLAVQFFTRLPVTGALAQWVGFSPAMLRASAAHFPGVGWLVGIAACAAFTASLLALPPTAHAPLVAAVLCSLATVLLTGAFHEDGLADLADGLGGSADRTRALEIMKDSRLGTYGVLALVLAVLLKVALLALLGAHSLPAALAALLAGHVVSRLWPLVVMRSLPYVGDEGGTKAKPMAEHVEPHALRVGAAWCLVPLAVAGFMQGWPLVLAGLLASAVGAALVGWRLHRRLQGFTGDGLGATQQLGELGFYLGAALALNPA